jgi:hypothetical protein
MKGWWWWWWWWKRRRRRRMVAAAEVVVGLGSYARSTPIILGLKIATVHSETSIMHCMLLRVTSREHAASEEHTHRRRAPSVVELPVVDATVWVFEGTSALPPTVGKVSRVHAGWLSCIVKVPANSSPMLAIVKQRADVSEG